MFKDNPYESPQAPQASPAAKAKANANYTGAACPNCGVSDARSPRFTLWGGAIGHRILSHVICNGCRKTFNSKTGKSNLGNIILYQVVVLGIAGTLGAMAGLFAWLG
ncbi:MAG: hypothetical protein COA78_01530 [Blastopirellula sp.]|nr:MAG: hypothetical protein COA78_01530 [Blastopirellula sp.]